MLSSRFWLILLLSLLIANLAFAARPRSSGLVLIAEGTDRDTQREVSEAILLEMRGQSSDELLAALADEGVTGPVGEALANRRKATIFAIQKAMRAAGVAAVLSVRTKRNKAGAREMHVVLLVSTQASPMIEEDFTLAPGEKATAKLGPLLAASVPDLVRSSSTTETASPPAASPGPTAAPTSVAPARADDERTGEKPSKRARPKKETAVSKDGDQEEPTAASDEPAKAPDRDRGATRKRTIDFTNATVIAEAAVGVARRQLQYSDPWVGRLRPYLAPGIVVYSVGAELYPGASTNTEVLKDIGVVGRFAGSLRVESVASDGQKAQGSFQRYAFGLRARIPTGDRKSRPLIGLEGTYGVWNFAFTGSDFAVDEAPSVQYKYVRAGADARFPYGPWAFFAGAGYMNISSAGTLSDRFPHLAVAGIDAFGGGTYAVAPPIELRLAITYARFFSSANPEPGAAFIAGGTLDQYVVATLGASSHF